MRPKKKILRFLPVTAFLLVSLALPHARASDEFYLLYRQWQPYDWPGGAPSASEVTRSQRGLGWHRQGTSGRFGVAYDYQPLGKGPGDPAHNGHLHRFMAGGHWQNRLFRVEARAGFAGTSNMFKYQDVHGDVVNGRVAMFRNLGADSPLSLGFGGDHRFGSFQWIPRVRWERRADNGHWLVDLPVMLRWQSPGRRLQLTLERRGDRWATLDQARQVESALYLREWRTELKYRISMGEGAWPSVVLGLGVSVDTRVRYRDLATGTRDQRLGDALLGSVRFGW